MSWVAFLVAALACLGAAFCVGFLAAFLGERWHVRRARRELERRRRGTYTTIAVTPGEEQRFANGIHVDVRGEPWVVVARGPGYVVLWQPWRPEWMEKV